MHELWRGQVLYGAGPGVFCGVPSLWKRDLQRCGGPEHVGWVPGLPRERQQPPGVRCFDILRVQRRLQRGERGGLLDLRSFHVVRFGDAQQLSPLLAGPAARRWPDYGLLLQRRLLRLRAHRGYAVRLLPRELLLPGRRSPLPCALPHRPAVARQQFEPERLLLPA